MTCYTTFVGDCHQTKKNIYFYLLALKKMNLPDIGFPRLDSQDIILIPRDRQCMHMNPINPTSYQLSQKYVTSFDSLYQRQCGAFLQYCQYSNLQALAVDGNVRCLLPSAANACDIERFQQHPISVAKTFVMSSTGHQGSLPGLRRHEDIVQRAEKR